MGASAVAGTAVTGTASASHADVWVWRTPTPSSGELDTAVSAINDAIDQLGLSGTFDVHNKGELSGNWPDRGDYGDYFDEFDNQRPFTYDGDLHYLIYWDGLVDGFSFSDSGAAGAARGHLTSSSSPTSIANADMSNYDGTTYRNFVKHEFLHPILDSWNAPETSNDHSYGAQKGWVCENTPMLTGYAESKRGGNDKPSECCNKNSVDTCDAHTGTLSDCTLSEAKRWMREVY
jgi:hypothetical protein